MKIKVGFFFIIILLCIVGILSLQKYDTKIEIILGEYVISTYMMIAFIILLIFFMLCLMIVNIALLPFQIINKINNIIQLKKEKNLLKYLIEASQFAIVGNSNKAYKMVQSILDTKTTLSTEIEDYFRFLCINLDLNFNSKLHYMKKILNSSNEFKFFIAKELSRLALQERSYHYSLEFGLIAFEIDNHDTELLKLLIEIYATLECWDKMSNTIQLLADIDRESFSKMNEKISEYYLKPAKHFIGLGELDKSIFYLIKCLKYKPYSLKCIELIANIHLESKEIDLRKTIETAFAIQPSFDLFLIYYQNYKSYLLTKDIYHNLIDPIDITKNKSLVISIAYFLNMKQELDNLILPII